jgi:hypothetical protein
MNAYDYLKAKRRLVTLRTQQYDLLDGVGRAPLQTHPNMAVYWQDADLGIDAIMPLMEPMLLIDAVDEKCFEEKFQYFAVGALRTSDAIAAGSAGKAVVDLRDPEVVRQALYLLEDIDDGLEDKKVQDREISWILVKYLLYYIEQCEFSDDLKVVLEMKKNKAPNKEIVEKLKADFGLSYQENYISTIFRKRILEPIAEQAQRHYRLIEFITMGPSVFKRCSKCGKLLPRNDTYFNKRSSTSDGFVSYCKKCKTQRK